MSLFKKNGKPLVFISKNHRYSFNEKTDLLLSPEFYWVKRVELNVKFANEVKKMAPSLFEDTLPKGRYEYVVFKITPKNFIILAYDLDYIKNSLSDLGIDLGLIDKIYLSQIEFLKDEVSAFVDEDLVLSEIDGIVVLIPSKYADAKSDINTVLKNKKVSKNYIYSSSYSKIKLQEGDYRAIFFLLFLGLLLLSAEILKTHYDIKNLDKAKSDFISNNSLPATMFQIDGIYNELKSISDKQIDLRRGVSYLSKFKMDKEEYFNSVSYKNSVLFFNIRLKSKKRYEEFQKFLRAKPNFKSLEIREIK